MQGAGCRKPDAGVFLLLEGEAPRHRQRAPASAFRTQKCTCVSVSHLELHLSQCFALRIAPESVCRTQKNSVTLNLHLSVCFALSKTR